MAMHAFWKASLFSMVASPAALLAMSTPEQYENAIAFFRTIDASLPYSIPNRAGESHADQPSKSCSPAFTSIKLDSRAEIGGDYTYVNFKPHGHQTFRGNLGGLQASYEWIPMNFVYAGVKFSWKEGDTHSPAGKRSLLYFDVQERIGYTAAFLEKQLQLTLFTGFGYRHLGQKLRPKEGDSLHFRYNEFYFPVGLMTNYDCISWFSVGANFTWMPQVYPTLAIAPLKGARWELSSTMANFFVEMPLTFTLTENRKFRLVLTPFYEHWQDGHSTAKLSTGDSLGIPGTTYNFYGVNLNFAYYF